VASVSIFACRAATYGLQRPMTRAVSEER